MLVFGDQVQEEDPRELLRALRRAVVRMPASGAPGDAGCSAHAQRVDCLLGAGALWQGLADADFAALGHDAETTRSRLCALGTVALARAVWASHRGMIVRHGRDLSDWIDRLLAEQLPSRIDLHRPEGFAFYAVYPEQYATAASRLSTVLARQGTVIVGLRTIGTSLAAMVAAGSGAQGLPWTARPVGPPFSRRLALSVQRSEQLRDARWVAAVDEGPGLSGSSFSAVANARQSAGGTAHGLHLFPSHPGPPGSQASDASRETWAHAQRHGATLEEVILPRLQSWVESRLECPVTLEDLSGGDWRARHYPSPQEWPATNARLERRKFLVRGRRGLHLLKFIGLGRYGEAPLQASRALSRAGFAPETLGSVHGFLLQRWCERAMPLDRVLLRGGGPQFDRRRLVEHLARYLAFRANHLPLDRAAHGAEPGRLLDMARHNVRLALGSDLAAALDRIRPPERLRPMWIDGRMHPWEWLVDGGEILKVDGVEHCQSHDLIGAQDLAWDVVGADVELGLTREACRELGLRLTQLTGRELPAASLGFHRICYLAFQLGQATLAAQMNEPEEARRLRARAEGYAGQLRSLLEPLSGGRSVRRAEHPPPL